MGYEKNRYLRLDASPIEHGQLRRFFSPVAFSTAFLISAAGTLNAAPEDIGDLIPAAVMATGGIVQRRILGVASNLSWLGDFNKYVIDTRPSQNIQSSLPPQYHSSALFAAALNTITPIGCLLNAGEMPSLGIDGAIQAPTFMNGMSQIGAYRNVKSGKWKVIKKTDMQPEPQEMAKTAPVLACVQR